MNVEHIGIAVEDLDAAEILFTKLLGVKPYKRETVETEGVITSFFDCGNIKIELLAAVTDQSPIAKFVEKKGPGLHHIALSTNNIQQTLNVMEEHQFKLINTQPKPGADNKEIAFLHPKSTMGVLTEFCADLKKETI